MSNDASPTLPCNDYYENVPTTNSVPTLRMSLRPAPKRLNGDRPSCSKDTVVVTSGELCVVGFVVVTHLTEVAAVKIQRVFRGDRVRKIFKVALKIQRLCRKYCVQREIRVVVDGDLKIQIEGAISFLFVRKEYQDMFDWLREDEIEQENYDVIMQRAIGTWRNAHLPPVQGEDLCYLVHFPNNLAIRNKLHLPEGTDTERGRTCDHIFNKAHERYEDVIRKVCILQNRAPRCLQPANQKAGHVKSHPVMNKNQQDVGEAEEEASKRILVLHIRQLVRWVPAGYDTHMQQ